MEFGQQQQRQQQSATSTSSTAIRSSLGSLEISTAIRSMSDSMSDGHRSLMRHFRSERNAVLIEVKERKSLLYFPDNNKTTWRWSTAFVRVSDWQIPPKDSCWWCGSGEGFRGYMWWIDQAGRGDPAMCPDGVCPDCFQTKKEKRELEQKTTTASSSQQPPASIQQPANP